MDRKLTFLVVLFTLVAILGGVTGTMADNYKETGISEYVDNIRIKGVRAISTIGETSYLVLSAPGYCDPVATQEILYRFSVEARVKVLSYNRYTPAPPHYSRVNECEGIEVIHDRPIR